VNRTRILLVSILFAIGVVVVALVPSVHYLITTKVSKGADQSGRVVMIERVARWGSAKGLRSGPTILLLGEERWVLRYDHGKLVSGSRGDRRLTGAELSLVGGLTVKMTTEFSKQPLEEALPFLGEMVGSVFEFDQRCPESVRARRVDYQCSSTPLGFALCEILGPDLVFTVDLDARRVLVMAAAE
jgi:hypothetical protein